MTITMTNTAFLKASAMRVHLSGHTHSTCMISLKSEVVSISNLQILKNKLKPETWARKKWTKEQLVEVALAFDLQQSSFTDDIVGVSGRAAGCN